MAFGNAALERAAIEMTYEDTATIKRLSAKQGAGSISGMDSIEIYTDIPCALSYSGSDSSTQTNAQQNIDFDAVIFASPELSIMPGDFIELQRFGANLEFEVVGIPNMYATHQEIKVRNGGLA